MRAIMTDKPLASQEALHKKSIITKARQIKRDVIPIHVNGRNSNFFYILANLRKFLRIKASLEIFFLPNESYNHRNKHYVITFGKPIPFETFDTRHNPLQWAQLVNEYTYALAEDHTMVFSENHA